jgi:glycosyltransferase involved in cell wall biosynthesis
MTHEMDYPKVSVVLTVLNEERNLQDLLESLAVQSVPNEVLVCDAGSTDRTVAITRRFAENYPQIRLLHAPGRRGATRNAGVRAARGDYVAFVDGDCIANPFWLERLLETTQRQKAPIVAGRTIHLGYWAFVRLGRVELPRRGQDVTVPSSNLLYDRRIFLALDGFDPRFITAEDMDLNFRAVEAGHTITTEEKAVVYHRARDTISGFIEQAFWNGYGRKQLTLKHGGLWQEYSFKRMLENQMTLWGLVRIAAATMGYLLCKIRETKALWRRPMPVSHEVHA